MGRRLNFAGVCRRRFAASPTPVDIARPGMDFDSSLFDLPFEDLASLSVDTQQQQFTASAGPMVDFQDFCSDFASGDFASSDFARGDFGTEGSDTTTSSWNFDLLPAVSPTHADVPAVKAPKEENSFKEGKDGFDTLGPYDSFQETYNYNMGSEVQVVPDMTPGEANAADFTLPSFSQKHNRFTRLANKALFLDEWHGLCLVWMASSYTLAK